MTINVYAAMAFQKTLGLWKTSVITDIVGNHVQKTSPESLPPKSFSETFYGKEI